MKHASDPNRKALNNAIAMQAGSRRDLQIAEQSSTAASNNLWKMQARINELHKEAVVPTGVFAAELISSISAGSPCDVRVLERSGSNARAALTAAENELTIWQQTYDECVLAVREKEADVAAAKERVERCAREIICNSETVKRLGDDLEALQAEIIEKRSVLRFLWGEGLNGELPGPLKERVERLLWRDLMGLESTSAAAAWGAAFEELQSNSDAKLPS